MNFYVKVKLCSVLSFQEENKQSDLSPRCARLVAWTEQASGNRYTPYQAIDCLHLNPAGKEIVSVLASWPPMDIGWSV